MKYDTEANLVGECASITMNPSVNFQTALINTLKKTGFNNFYPNPVIHAIFKVYDERKKIYDQMPQDLEALIQFHLFQIDFIEQLRGILCR